MTQRPSRARAARAVLLPARAAALAAAIAAAAPPPAAADGAPPPLRCGTGIHAGEASGWVWLPQGDVFCPLIADPKGTRSHLTYLRGELPADTGARNVGSVGIADGMGLVRVGRSAPGDGVQLGIEAGVFAQFDLGTRSADLLNSDWVIGFPITFRVGGLSGRLRVWHQSSHLGDEFLARAGAEVTNEGLSFEAVEAMFSQELGAFRAYAGVEYLLDATPSTLDPVVLHGGAELRLGPVRGPRLVAALDVKAAEQRGFEPAYSARAGVEIAHWSSPAHPPRVIAVLAEYYEGPSPFGQFFTDQSRTFGFGFHFQR
ncbi:MAG TPA: DUF1207 domain-containing protein [Anaeromyxobacter sp.]|nr:DUF1207 domain-containing protein [Anaeromyxobacter sp.]